MFDLARHKWLRETLAPARLTHIVDVGANPAEPVDYQDLLDAGGCRLTGFEPQPHACDKLQAAAGPNETYFPYAVGDGKTRDLHFMSHDTMTSFYKGNAASLNFLNRFGAGLQIKQTAAIDTVALDQSLVGDFDLLKIDIQGGETIVFDGAKDALSRAVAVIPEVRWYALYQDEPMFAGVDSALRNMGFALHKFLFNKSYFLPTSQMDRLAPGMHDNQLIDGDAVYIRDMANLKSYTSEHIKHLAIMADAIWFSFDLVIRCLDILVNNKLLPATVPAAYVDCLPPHLLNSSAAAPAQ